MITALNIAFCILLYLFIGYFVGIVRYRFVHSEKARNVAWRNTWQAWMFYPMVRRIRETGYDSFTLASHRALGSLSRVRLVFNMKPAPYISLLMLVWGPLLFCVAVVHVCLTFYTIVDFIWKKMILGIIDFCVDKLIQFIKWSLPKDLKDMDDTLL